MSTDQSTTSAAPPPVPPTARTSGSPRPPACAAPLRASFVDRLRGGDLGLVPVVGGLVVIAVVLQVLNPVFLSSTNLVNLLLESRARSA